MTDVDQVFDIKISAILDGADTNNFPSVRRPHSSDSGFNDECREAQRPKGRFECDHDVDVSRISRRSQFRVKIRHWIAQLHAADTRSVKTTANEAANEMVMTEVEENSPESLPRTN
jgi:hypothetical protein